MRATIAAILAAIFLAIPATARAASPTYLTLLFSRTEQGSATACSADAGQPTLQGDIAPYLQSLGLTAFGTVNTLATASAEGCVHYSESLTSDWSQLQELHSTYGWQFGPHEYDGPAKVATLTDRQKWNVTCGQAQTLSTQGLGAGTGLIAYPGLQQNNSAISDLQTSYGANCFAWGRKYGSNGITTQPNNVAPYWQSTEAFKGGPGQGSPAYTQPADLITQIQALQPGQWLTLQTYVLVTGSKLTGTDQWDCDATPHWSNNVERYCYSDWQQVIQAIAQDSNLTVTDPLTVGEAFGRPSAYGMPRP